MSCGALTETGPPKGWRAMHAASLFTPIVDVGDNGQVTIDWSSSFDHTYDIESAETLPDSDRHCDLLDSILGSPQEFTEPQRLRRLADYMEEHA